MEAFFKEISAKLEKNSVELGDHIEPQHKTLLANSHECMALCYRSAGSIESASVCAEKCHDPVEKTQKEIERVVGNIQSYFQNCMQGCKLTHGEKELELKACISDCTDKTLEKFVQAKATTAAIINRYIN